MPLVFLLPLELLMLRQNHHQLQKQQLGDALQALTQVLNDDRVINDTLAVEVKTHQKVLAAYLASQPVPSAPDAPVDPTSYAGRLQAIVNELPTVVIRKLTLGLTEDVKVTIDLELTKK